MLCTLRELKRHKIYYFYANIRGPVTNSAPFRALGFKKLLFVNLPDMDIASLHDLQKLAG